MIRSGTNMPKMIHWIEAHCDWCKWHSDMGRPGDCMMMNEWREHKRNEHPEKCKGCIYAGKDYCYGKCSENKKAE